MRIVTATCPPGSTAQAYALDGDAAMPFRVEPGAADPVLRVLGSLEQRSGSIVDQLDALLDPACSVDRRRLVVRQPIRRPGKIMAIGLNYRDHCQELGLQEPTSPVVFTKYPTSTLAPEGTIVLPASAPEAVDYEAELCVVIGRRCRDVSPEEALRYVLGYTAANDVSARDVQSTEAQWTRAKSFDSFCPLGPSIVTCDDIPDPQRLRLRLAIGNEKLQESTTAEMVFPCRELVAFLSRSTTLEPGDLILTGTPSGVGAGRKPKRFLREGDVVTVMIESIGSLTNVVGAAVGPCV